MWGALAMAMGHQSDDTEALARSLSVPLLILVGEQDAPLVTASNDLKRAIPSASLVVIPDAGHSPQFENPHAWIDAMLKFLAAVPAPAR